MPGDAFVSVATHVVPGDLLQKVLLVGALRARRRGRRAAGRGRPGLGRAAAVVLFLWNPWVLERLAHRPVGRRSSATSSCRWIGLAAVRAARRLAPGGRRRSRSGWERRRSSRRRPAWSAALTALVVVLARPRLRSVAARSVLGGPGQPALARALAAGSAPGDGPGRAVRRPSRPRAESPPGCWPACCRSAACGRRASCPRSGRSRRGRAAPCLLTVVALLGLRLGAARGATCCVRRPGAGRGRGRRPSCWRRCPGVASALDDGWPTACPRSGCCVTPTGTWPGRAGAAARLAVDAAAACRSERRPGARRCGVLAVLVVLLPVLCCRRWRGASPATYDPVGYPAEWTPVSSKTLPRRTHGRAALARWLPRLRVERPAGHARPGAAVLPGRGPGRRPALLSDGRVLGSEDPLLRRVDAALRSADPAAGAARPGRPHRCWWRRATASRRRRRAGGSRCCTTAPSCCCSTSDTARDRDRRGRRGRAVGPGHRRRRPRVLAASRSRRRWSADATDRVGSAQFSEDRGRVQ